MRILRTITIISILLVASSQVAGAQGIKGREILGIRLGGIWSPGEVREQFGDGTELELHFTEGLGPWYGIDISISMHNLGKAKEVITDPQAYFRDWKVEAQVYSVTAGFVGIKGVSKGISIASELGMGLYTINAIIPNGLYEGRIYRNQFGFYGGLNFYYALTSGGLALDIGAKYHYVLSGDDRLQVLHAFTGEDRLSFFQVTVGIVFFTR